ncbi:unnamed protein product [Moneuplotes crassus]|uniref:Uncharacterized protein n=1 Tax=Euplotes crassus TaxID=5936 RepID=A0AAD1XHU8_EUPCR|nr:unnamed protein product [Moneuplotes crassus]
MKRVELVRERGALLRKGLESGILEHEEMKRDVKGKNSCSKFDESKSSLQDSKTYSDCYENIIFNMLEGGHRIGPNNCLNIFLSNTYHHPFLTKLSKLHLPKLSKTLLCDLTRPSGHIKRFLSHCILPTNLQILSLKCLNLSPITAYLPSLIKSCHKATCLIDLGHFVLSGRELKKLFVAVRLVKTVRFQQCRIGMRENGRWTRAMRGSCIKEIELWDCEKPEYSNWSSDLSGLSHLANWFSNTDLRDTLKEIGFGYTHLLAKRDVEEVFDENGLGHVQITGNFAYD